MGTPQNKITQLTYCQEWIERIADRLGPGLQRDLIMTVPEIITNLVKYGFAGGAFVISVWPSGQVELLWTNRIDHIKNWPAEDTAKGLAEACLYHNGGGSGMAYILNTLLPSYSGVLGVNYRGNDVLFNAGNYAEIHGHGRRSDIFLPRSILFTLQLFASDVRERIR